MGSAGGHRRGGVAGVVGGAGAGPGRRGRGLAPLVRPGPLLVGEDDGAAVLAVLDPMPGGVDEGGRVALRIQEPVHRCRVGDLAAVGVELGEGAQTGRVEAGAHVVQRGA